MALRKEDKEGGALKTFGVPSKSGKGVHEVVRWASGVWSCSCTHWIIKLSHEPRCTPKEPTRAETAAWHAAHSDRGAGHCSHIKDCIAGRVKATGQVFVVQEPTAQAPAGRAKVQFGGEV